MTTKHFFTPKSVFQILTSIILILLLANIFGIYLWSRDPDDSLTLKVIRLFDLNQVFNVPTVFMSGLLLMTTILLFKTGNRKDEITAPWYGLAFFFLFLAGSKAFQIQKIIGWIMRNHLLYDSTSLIIFSIIVVLSLILLLKDLGSFLSKLPKSTMARMAVAMSIFLFGAIGVDYLGGLHSAIHGNDLTYKFYYTVEETLEMIGISFFLYVLVKYRNKQIFTEAL